MTVYVVVIQNASGMYIGINGVFDKHENAKKERDWVNSFYDYSRATIEIHTIQ